MMENIVWGILIGCVSAVALAMLISVAKDHWQSKKEKKEDTFVPSGKTVFFTIDWMQGMVLVSTRSSSTSMGNRQSSRRRTAIMAL